MANPIKLAIDRQARRLVAYQGSALALPDLFQSNVQDFQITIVDPSTDVTSPYSAVDMNGFGLRVSVGQTPTGTSGGPTPLALQDTWTWSAANKYFTASLALNTTDIDTYIGSAASKQAYFEVNTTLAGARITVFQATFNLKAVVDELTSTTPSPTDQYLTKAECLALFQKMIGDAGQRLVFKSASGVYGRELGVNDDGTALDNIITL